MNEYLTEAELAEHLKTSRQMLWALRKEGLTNEQGYRVYYVKEVVGKGDGPAPVAKSEDVGW